MTSRICRIDDQLLAFSASLSPSARIRQADRIRMLYLAVHRPYRKPSIRFFDTNEKYFRFQRSDKSTKDRLAFMIFNHHVRWHRMNRCNNSKEQ